jgi:maltodextrin utilization protein YvdJ
MAPALAGIQTIIAEITEKKLKRIEQENGIILVISRPDFSVVALTSEETYPLLKNMEKLADYVTDYLLDKMTNFRGRVDDIQTIMDEYMQTSGLDRYFVN